MIELAYFSFLYSLIATVLCKVIYGVKIKFLPLMFLALLTTGMAMFVLLGYSSIFRIFFGIFLTFIVGSAYFFGGVNSEMGINTKENNTKKIIFATTSAFSLFFFWNTDKLLESDPFKIIGQKWLYIFDFIILSVVFISSYSMRHSKISKPRSSGWINRR